MTTFAESKKFLALFAITVLLTTSLALQYAPTASAQVRICGDKICDANSGPEAEKEREKMRQDVKSGTAPSAPEEPEEEAAPKMEEKKMEEKEEKKMEEKKMEQKMEEKKEHKYKVASGTITSMTDPGVGHETHQLAIILPPSDKVYKGTLSYSASEPIQLVALHGPLAEGEDAGQMIWTPDGETKFALTFIDPKTAMGSWTFSGNALAVHTLNQDPFTVSYSVNYAEKEMSDTVKTETITSMTDPGVGHETHQLAIILPPSDKVYSGLLTYSASEPIQLVALHGPLAEGEDAGQMIWTPDGETKFALTFVDSKAAAGTWMFSGNALAVHTLNQDPFTVSYSVVAGK